MKYTITGDNLQFVNVELAPGEEILSEAGAMTYMTGNMRMETEMTGGLFSGLKRSMSGESLFLVKYRPENSTGIVGFGGHAPGKILDIDVGKGAWLVQKTGYLASQTSVKLDMAIQKRIGAGFFGGEGFILQKLSGSGIAFIEACGDLVTIDLKPGEMYKVSTSNAVAWEESVKYDISAVGGVKNTLFGGEGLFVTTLTGPGRVVLQSMTLQKLANSLIPYLPKNN